MTIITIQPNPALSEWDIALTATEAQIKNAATRALNKTARWSSTQISRQTAQALKVKVSLVREGVTIVRARRNRLQSLVGLKKTAGVIKGFDLGNATQTQQGVRVGRRRFDKAFIADMKSGYRGIFKRKTKSRLPIREVQLVITGKMRNVMDNLSQGEARQRFEVIFDRELRHLLRAG